MKFKGKEEIKFLMIAMNEDVKLSFFDTTWGAHYLTAYELFKKPILAMELNHLETHVEK